MRPWGLHFEKFSAHEVSRASLGETPSPWSLGGFTLSDSQLMKLRKLQFHRFSAHKASGASLWETRSSWSLSEVSLWKILSSWNFWCFTSRDSQLIGPLGPHLKRFSAHEASGIPGRFSAHGDSGASLSGVFSSWDLGGFTYMLSSWGLGGLHFGEILSSWGFVGFTLRDAQLMRLLVLHFERFTAHKASGASLWEIPSSWGLGGFILKDS